jgi:hypothetical protein
LCTICDVFCDHFSCLCVLNVMHSVITHWNYSQFSSCECS